MTDAKSDPNFDTRRRDRGARLVQMFREIEGEVKAFAVWKAAPAKARLAARGIVSGRLEYRDLIGEAWRLLIEDEEREFSGPDALKRYFFGQISGRIIDTERMREVNAVLLTFADHVSKASDSHTISIDDSLLKSHESPEQLVSTSDFLNFLALHDPLLRQLLKLALEGVRKRSDQARELRVSVQAIYRMAARIKKLWRIYSDTE
jgi:hypothetical protein